MFKFDMIESHHREFREPFVEGMKKILNLFLEKDDLLEIQRPYLFILGKGRQEDIIGGACLQKLNLYDIQEDVRELVATLPLHGYVWQCSNVYFEMPSQALSSSPPQLDYFSRSFYRGLYEAFVEFGKMKGVGFVIMKLPPHVYLSTKEFGLWPYVVELRPDNSPDGLFHGILPLTGSQSLAYQKLS